MSLEAGAGRYQGAFCGCGTSIQTKLVFLLGLETDRS